MEKYGETHKKKTKIETPNNNDMSNKRQPRQDVPPVSGTQPF